MPGSRVPASDGGVTDEGVSMADDEEQQRQAEAKHAKPKTFQQKQTTNFVRYIEEGRDRERVRLTCRGSGESVAWANSLINIYICLPWSSERQKSLSRDFLCSRTFDEGRMHTQHYTPYTKHYTLLYTIPLSAVCWLTESVSIKCCCCCVLEL